MIILKANQENLKEIVEIAAKSIKQGKVIVSPTDTVYGLIGDATNKKAVGKIFKIKKRPKNKPLPIFVKNLAQAKKLAKINKKQEKFLKKAWPGNITVVLEAKKGVKLHTIYQNTIGVRMPDFKMLNILLKRLNRPLAETSVNISGKPPLTEIKKITTQFKNRKCQPDLIIDAGNLKTSKPSTVIDLTGKKNKILRK